MPSIPSAPHTRVGWGNLKQKPVETRVRVQIVPICICVVASVAFVLSASNLPWFGGSDPSIPRFSAISASGLYVSPGSSAGLAPGTQSWGYLMVAWSLLLVVLALIAAVACAVRRRSHRRGPHGLLLCVGVVSLVLIALVIPESMAHVQTDLVSFASFSWGTILGLGLALLAAVSAWFAWATLKFPHLWGIEPEVE